MLNVAVLCWMEEVIHVGDNVTGKTTMWEQFGVDVDGSSEWESTISC